MDLPAHIGGRIGILGGTFDPVHNGHLAVAGAARTAFGLDSVLFIPAAQPPHKPNYQLSVFDHRAAMLELATAGRPGFFVSRLEAERQGPSFSIDTVKTLRAGLGDAARFFFLIGMDAFVDITTWKAYRELFDHSDFVVIDRPDQCHERLADFIAANLPGFFHDQTRSCWTAPGIRGSIHPLAMEPVAVSSTQIRALARQGKDISGLVPGGVKEYIETHGLYACR